MKIILLKDILETNPDKDYFARYNKIDSLKNTLNLIVRRNTLIKKLDMIPRDYIKDNERQRRVYSVMGKSPTILARSDFQKFLHLRGLENLPR